MLRQVANGALRYATDAILCCADLSQAMDNAMRAIGMEVSPALPAVGGPQHSNRERELLSRIADLEQQLAGAR